MDEPAHGEVPAAGPMRSCALFSWIMMAAAGLGLLVCMGTYFAFAYAAVRWPFGLDYAEGEVWEQALLITGPHAYGGITSPPWIGFEYPPAYPLITLALSRSWQFLAEGRVVSLCATMISAGLAGRLAAACAGWRVSERRGWLAALLAAALVVTLPPVIEYSALARVDMFQVSLALTGMAFSLAALSRPAWLYGAVLLFVLAGFTKQTALAAPAATFIVMMLRMPRICVKAFGAGAALAAGLFLFWNIRTHGGFLRHLVLYNIEKVSLIHFLGYAFLIVGQCGIPIVLAAAALLLRWRTAWPGRSALLSRVRGDHVFAQLLLVTIYFLALSGLTALAGKAGASVNYFLEFLCVCCAWSASLVVRSFTPVPEAGPAAIARPFWAMLVPTALLLHCWFCLAYLQTTLSGEFGPAKYAERAALLRALTAMPGPILSDDMAMVRLAGKTPQIEPYLFSQLSKAGVWDETALDDMIKRRQFSAVLTYKDPGSFVFDDRFTPGMTTAITANYPRVSRFGDDRLRQTR